MRHFDVIGIDCAAPRKSGGHYGTQTLAAWLDTRDRPAALFRFTAR